MAEKSGDYEYFCNKVVQIIFGRNKCNKFILRLKKICLKVANNGGAWQCLAK
jgi:hypothetical protein